MNIMILFLMFYNGFVCCLLTTSASISTDSGCLCSFTDPNNRRPCAALEWNPEGATQLIVASADDRSPSLQVVLNFKLTVILFNFNGFL